jgi:hypothetical protein
VSPPVRGVGGLPLTAMALALGIWGFPGRSAMAQAGGVGGAVGAGIVGGQTGGGTAYSGPGIPPGYYGGAVHGGYGPGYGTFGPGYPGFGLDYGCEGGCWFPHRHDSDRPSVRRWCSYVLGGECLYPYVADPYSDPRALGFWPPYSAPVASAANLRGPGQ